MSSWEISLPNFEEVSNDLKKLENDNIISLCKLKKVSKEVNELKVRKQTLKSELNDINSSITYYEKLYVDLMKKTEIVQINKNKTNLIACSNLQTIQDLQGIKTAINTDLEESNFEMDEYNKHTIEKFELSQKKLKLKDEIFENSIKVKEMLNKLNVK